MKHLDLFSGIGGFALAARWVGWETVGFCEIDPWCRKILEKHWPGVKQYEDICDVTEERLRADGIIGAGAGEGEVVGDTDSERGNGRTTQQWKDGRDVSTRANNGIIITGGFHYLLS